MNSRFGLGPLVALAILAYSVGCIVQVSKRGTLSCALEPGSNGKRADHRV
jgi:hypothetical protein